MPLVIAISLGGAVGCRTSQPLPEDHAAQTPPAHLADCITGTFTSAAQAEANLGLLLEIRLVMAPIWIDRSDLSILPGDPPEYFSAGLSIGAGEDDDEREDVNRPGHERPDHL